MTQEAAGPALPPLPAAFASIAEWAAGVTELAGIVTIIAGAALATLVFAQGLRARTAFSDAYRAYRANLGRAILLGLEFLIAADILRTVAIEPTLGGVAVLAAIVLVRTFLSFTLQLEIEGRWPWQGKAPRN